MLLPLKGLYAPQNIDKAPTVTVNTSGVSGANVEVPVVNKGPGIVAVLARYEDVDTKNCIVKTPAGSNFLPEFSFFSSDLIQSLLEFDAAGRADSKDENGDCRSQTPGIRWKMRGGHGSCWAEKGTRGKERSVKTGKNITTL